MAGRLRTKRLDASFYIPQEYPPFPHTLVRTSFKLFKDNTRANEEPLPFGQSYWDYLPDLVQNKIVKMVHKSLLEEVHDELLLNCWCPNCGELFMNPFKSAKHLSDEVCRESCDSDNSDSDLFYFYYDYESSRYPDCGCTPHCECVWEWDDWTQSQRCECCLAER